MMEYEIKIIVSSSERIDKYISQNSKLTRSDAQKLIKQGVVFVDDKKIRKANFIVHIDNVIYIQKLINREINAIPENIPLDIIYEDDEIIIVNKKSGMVVHPAPGQLSGTLVNALLYNFKKLSDINGNVRPGIVHRIDKDTSGLLVVAKTREAHVFLASELKEHKIKRTYYALIEGHPKNKIIHIDLPIGRDPKHRQKMAVTKFNSKKAITHVFVEKYLENQTLVRCELETGRTHQIRVHLSYIKHPIVGDSIYGHKIDNFNQRLHAYQLELKHPKTKKIMKFTASLPKEFAI